MLAKRSCIAARWTGLAALIVSSVAVGQAFPNKPIRMVTTSPGGGNDFASRLIAQGIAGPLGQPMIVDNRMAGNIPVEIVFRAPADGYTLLQAGSSFWSDPLLQKTPTYDVVKDFAPVTLVSQQPSILVVNPSLPVSSVKDLIALAKAKPNVLNYAFASRGGTPHLMAELFKSMAGVNIVGVAYRGSVQTVAALMSNEVQMSFADIINAAPQIKSGKLKALAVTSAKLTALAPGVPTVADSGLPGYELIKLNGIWAPAKTPEPIVKRLNQEIFRVLSTPDSREKLLAVGQEFVASTPEQFAAIQKAEIAKVSALFKNLGIEPE